MSLDHVTIVLSHPSEPRNIGASCRAMKNAGITHLVIVSDSEIDFVAARPLAVDAGDVLKQALVVRSLPDAVAGHALVAGTTRRTGQRRKTASFSPWQLADKVVAMDAGGGATAARETATGRDEAAPQVDAATPRAAEPGIARAAIVFGNEQSGLSDAELEVCLMAVNIPSHPSQPSLNLSHAVQVICYELFLATLAAGEHGEPRRPSGASGSHVVRPEAEAHQPVTTDQLESEVQRITAALNSLGFHTQAGPRGMPALLRDLLGRALASQDELARLRAMFEKLDGMHR